MKPWLALSVMAGTLAAAGCNTYHYYDIDIKFGTITEPEAGVLQLCQLDVSGAASHSASLPSSSIGDPTTVCPIAHNWPDLGRFEFATFADSGSITFTIKAYKDTARTDDNLCTTGSLTMTATSQITQQGTMTMGAFDDTKCPNNVVPPLGTNP